MSSLPAASRPRQHATLGFLGACALLALLGAGMAGSVPIPLHEVPEALASLAQGAPGGMAATLLDLRLGRASSAFVTGAALAGREALKMESGGGRGNGLSGFLLL